MAEIGGDLYFLAEGKEAKGLWVRDSRGKTRPVRTLPINGPMSKPRLLASLGDRLFFTAWDGAWDGSPVGLWSSAGTPETTVPVNLPNIAWDDVTRLAQAAGLLFFQTDEPHDLWRTDGTPQGTFVVAHLQGTTAVVPFHGSLYFFDGGGIWKTDGTVQGTVKTGDLPADLLSVDIAAPGPNGMYLKTVTAPYKTELWFTDGTSAGTRQFTNFNLPGVFEGDPQFTSVGSHVYFYSSYDFRIWKTDGTVAGTTSLEGLPEHEYPLQLVAHQGALYLFTEGPYPNVTTVRLWRADETTAGAVELARFPRVGSSPWKPTSFAGKLFFNVDDGVHGDELWSTDGTSAGTALVRDILPGPRASSPIELTVAGGRLFFTADDNFHGRELWQSDGTAAGTRLVQDIGPQAASGDPFQLTVVGDKLYFAADDGVTGREVWVLPLAGPTVCRPSSTRLCLSGGRYAVEAAWQDFQGHRGVGHAVPLTADTGYFWFFDAANVETVLKILDGRGVNGHVWVFYGALSNVEYTLTVTDTETGLARRYINPSGVLASAGDTLAFGPLGASAQSVATSVAQPSPLALVDRRVVPAAATGSCAPNSTRLCLRGSRFAVEIAWKDFSGNQGTGKAVELTNDTGWFWFFDPANVEVVLKVLDGTPVNGHHWVFYGALSNVEYTVTVTDTETGEIKIYRNPRGRLASVADTGAF
ncbi:MAG TPA: ELWxxDGT repeat protein [Thermoanaerobaculia bacterium]|nr:ELWxxDGT repeat protein [Thermoanaerobaculia bacterium]